MSERALKSLRRRLHRLAEPSGLETATAALVAAELAAAGPDGILTGLGGHGVAAVWSAADGAPGPSVLLRAELDAVAVPETIPLHHASERAGTAHKCGHDGHMTILLGVATRLAVAHPPRGRVILLFQPAEETGAGAAAVAADPRFAALRPDWLFALHNLPGYDAGRVLVRPGAFAAGSAGLRIRLRGRTAHAAEPEKGRSPDLAMGEIITALVTLPPRKGSPEALELVTVTHARLGEPAFGSAPGEAEILATLRADDDDALAALRRQATGRVRGIARAHGLSCAMSWEEVFPVTWNDPEAVKLVRRAARTLGLPPAHHRESAFRWSEDFGVLARLGRGALFGLGAGRRHPGLHAAGYDFNDDLLAPGVDLMHRVALTALAEDPR
jgi:amidohydrolase